MVQFGRIKVIIGENNSRYPYCTSIFVDDDIKAVIDPGAGVKALQELKQHNHIDLVYNTHFHYDHMAYNYLFDQAMLYINEQESMCYTDRKSIVQRMGMTDFFGDDYADKWVDYISNPNSQQSPISPQKRHEWFLSTSMDITSCKWGDVFDFGSTKMEVIGTPGHSQGFNCPYFPEEGVVYTGDYDLGGFGPWYGGKDCDLELFVQSADKLLQLDANTYVTGHQKGIVNRAEFKEQLKRFMSVIDKRDQMLLAALSFPISLKDLADQGLIYGKMFMIDEWVRAWEEMMDYCHLQRLLKNQLIVEIDGLYHKNN